MKGRSKSSGVEPMNVVVKAAYGTVKETSGGFLK